MKQQRKLPLLKITLVTALLSIMTIGLDSCSKIPAYVRNPTVDNLTNQQKDDLFYVQHTGIQVIKQGMRFTFVIPVDCFFVKETRELKSFRGKDLGILSRFIRSYTHYFAHPKISVIGYTDTVLLGPARDKLSLRYAETIASYLQENGVATEDLDIHGAGASNPVASNAYPLGSSFNRRVEIIIH